MEHYFIIVLHQNMPMTAKHKSPDYSRTITTLNEILYR